MPVRASPPTPRRLALVTGGVFTLVVGIVLVTQPLAFARGVIWFYGLFVLATAVALLAYDVLDRQEPRSLPQGLAGICIGILLMVFPGMTLNFALIFIALWLLTLGLTQALHGILLRKFAIGTVIFASGIFCLIMAAMLLFYPAIPLLAIGYYMIIYGVVMLWSSMSKY